MFFCAQKRFFTIKKHIARILDAYCTVKTERDRKKVNFCQKLQTLKKITPSSGENNSKGGVSPLVVRRECKSDQTSILRSSVSFASYAEIFVLDIV